MWTYSRRHQCVCNEIMQSKNQVFNQRKLKTNLFNLPWWIYHMLGEHWPFWLILFFFFASLLEACSLSHVGVSDSVVQLESGPESCERGHKLTRNGSQKQASFSLSYDLFIYLCQKTALKGEVHGEKTSVIWNASRLKPQIWTSWFVFLKIAAEKSDQ